LRISVSESKLIFKKNVKQYLLRKRKKANALTDAQKMAETYCDKVKPYFEVIREHCDKLELLVDDEVWTLTKYRELLFTR